jgi:hypothetical protein
MRQKERVRRGDALVEAVPLTLVSRPRLFRGAVSGSDMRNSFSSLLAAATLAFGLSAGAPNSAHAESVMQACASQWKQAQTTGATGGQSWPQFLAQCRTSQNSPASTPASAPAPTSQSGSLFPWSQSPAPASATGSNVGAGQSVMKLCASQWRDAKAAGTTGGQSWPQFLAQCRTRQGSPAAPSGSFTSAPAPAPAPASPSGSLFPWWQQSAPASAPGTTATPRAGEYTTELAARARCPSDTVVWANTPTRIYHYSGTRYFGHTRNGAYMCEADARTAGYRASRSRQREAGTPSG